MASDQEKIAKLTFGTAVLAVLVSGLQDFGMQIIARGRKTRLSRRALDETRQICITNAKNIDLSGMPIETEAEMFRQAIDQLEKFIDAAIAKGWQL
jgi:hypothetical protein